MDTAETTDQTPPNNLPRDSIDQTIDAVRGLGLSASTGLEDIEAPVGIVWQEFRKSRSTLKKLPEDDESKPSPALTDRQRNRASGAFTRNSQGGSFSRAGSEKMVSLIIFIV
jgi:hypothetical protein